MLMKKIIASGLLMVGLVVLGFTLAVLRSRCTVCNGVGTVCSVCGEPWSRYEGCDCVEAGPIVCDLCNGEGALQNTNGFFP